MSGTENTQPLKRNNPQESEVVLAYNAPAAVVVQAVTRNNITLTVHLRFLIVILPCLLTMLQLALYVPHAHAPTSSCT